MAKSARAKKQKKTAKLKPILKLSRKLKKSQNESKTDFKVRKIIIKEQFEDHPTVGLADRNNLSIKDLLSHLRHHNKLVLTDSIDRLREIVQSQESHLYRGYISAMIKGLGPCLIDLTSAVRKSSIKCINMLIQMNRREVQPLLHFLVSYASCAMVHIDVDVQEDSLLIVDSIRVMVPLMKAEMVNMLLSNFLGLITRKIKGADGQSSTTLVFSPDNILTHVNWRAKLLSTLGNFLGTIVKHYNKSEKCDLNSEELILRNYFPTTGNAGNNIYMLNIFTKSAAAESFVKNVMEILYVTWIETSLQNVNVNEKGLTHIEVYEIILNIINLLQNISIISENNDPTESDWYRKCMKKNFEDKIIKGFPYSSSVQCKNTNEDLITDSWDLNIAIATLAMTLLEKKPKLKMTIMKYFTAILNNINNKKNHKMEKIVSVCLKLIEDDSKVDLKLQELLLGAALNCFRMYGMPSEEENNNIRAREQLLALPVRAAEWECSDLRKSGVLMKWVKVLVCESDKDWPAVKNALIDLKLRNPPNFKETIIEFAG